MIFDREFVIKKMPIVAQQDIKKIFQVHVQCICGVCEHLRCGTQQYSYCAQPFPCWWHKRSGRMQKNLTQFYTGTKQQHRLGVRRRGNCTCRFNPHTNMHIRRMCGWSSSSKRERKKLYCMVRQTVPNHFPFLFQRPYQTLL